MATAARSTGLGREDFRIEVDGRPRRIVSAQFVDLAGSINPSAHRSAAHFSSNAGAGDGRIVVIAVDETHIRRLEGRRALEAAAQVHRRSSGHRSRWRDLR